MEPKVERISLPANVAKDMKLANMLDGMVTKSYVEFHKDLAEKRLAVLKAHYGLRVIETKMRSAGWCDGMMELNAVVETKRGNLRKLIWCDANQDFMVKMELGGQGAISVNDLA